MAADVAAPGTTEHARHVRELVERHRGARGRSPSWAVCQICGQLGSARGYAQGMARSSSPAGRDCGRHGDRRHTAVAAFEHPDRYCEVCASTVGEVRRSATKLCAACELVWGSAPHELLTELGWLRGVARHPLRRGELGALLRLVEHPRPRFLPLTAERVRRISAEHRLAMRKIDLLCLRDPVLTDVDGLPHGSPEALARIAELEELVRIDPTGDLVAAGEQEDPLRLRPFVRDL